MTQLPVNSSSDSYIASLGASTPIHPDFGSYPISSFPVNIVHGNSVPPATVYVAWPFTSDPGPYPIPVNAVIGPGGDDHLIVLDQDNCVLYEAFGTTQNGDGSFNVDNIVKFNLYSYATLGPDWSSSNAAGTPQLPLLVRYDEVAVGYVGHAISITGTPTGNSYVWPAVHSASSNATAPPMGTRFRLKANYDISGFSPTNQVILQAMKTFGLLLTDNGASWHIQGVPDPRWSDADLHSLTLVPGSAFEAVDESSLMVSPISAQVQSTVTASSSSTVNPSAGTGLSQSFTFTFPGSNYTQAHMLVNTALTGYGSCYAIYDEPSNSIYLATNDGNHITGPMPIGSSSILSNTQCSVAGSSVAVSAGSNLTITLTMNFVTGFAGAKNIYTSFVDGTGARAGWSQIGTWAVPVSAAPVSVMPSGGIGPTQSFSFSFTNPAGAGASIYGQVHMLFNSSLTGVSACYIIYDQLQNRWGISNDPGTAIAQWQPAGSATVLANSQCSVPVSSATATLTATTLSISITPTFTASFSGARNIYAATMNDSYALSAWAQVGTWSATAGSDSVSVNPSSGIGSWQNFTFTFSNVAGASNYGQVHMLFNSSFTGLNSCYLLYDRLNNQFGIGNDQASAVSQWAYPGSTTVLSNSQCSVPMGNAWAVVSGNSITVTLTPTFSASFGGALNIYTDTRDNSYDPAPWQQVGNWTAPQ